MEEPGKGRRATNEITGSDGQTILIAFSKLSEHGRKVFRATRWCAIDGTGRVRLKMAVIVVEGKYLKIDELTLWVGVTRAASFRRYGHR
jgi:hypothetical protein